MRVGRGGKDGLAKALEKEEREYIEAAQAEHNANQELLQLKVGAEELRKTVNKLELDVAERKDMVRRLAEIYRNAFTGPTPGILFHSLIATAC